MSSRLSCKSNDIEIFNENLHFIQIIIFTRNQNLRNRADEYHEIIKTRGSLKSRNPQNILSYHHIVHLDNMSLLKTIVRRTTFVLLPIFTILLIYVYNVKVFEMEFKEKDILMQRKIYNILQWTSKSLAPFSALGVGNSAFVIRKCNYTNCFITNNRTYMLNLTSFDAIAFNGRQVIYLKSHEMPKSRNKKQKYIFVTMESCDRFPACSSMLDGYFNWTWTYKLDSDFRFGYITIYDLAGNAVGPAMDMQWPELKPIGEDLKTKLLSKSKAAAWFVSHCSTTSKRESFVKDVQKELEPFGWTVDVYGACGTFSCPRSEQSSCFHLVEKDYYFYFSLENSFAEDYVTEKLLTALNNYAVPVVFGSANYSRFLPPGSYLDGMKLGPKNLARVMNEIIRNKTLYYDFFRWRNHYVYKDTSNTVDICKLCDMMNDEEKVAQKTVWYNFRSWWNGARYKYNCKFKH